MKPYLITSGTIEFFCLANTPTDAIKKFVVYLDKNNSQVKLGKILVAENPNTGEQFYMATISALNRFSYQKWGVVK